ncbi:BofC C-terminal domain-containing protein [Paenibacillus humicola]|uniref:BofC C-terminal domain-containing protein n=1 Tax=Paenibacillus humicola TaxID=3110540 RepID=UPI00237A9B4F|nr:BofC C-terminal domain-containing protein [Paenibacillus humicola]
MAFSLWKQLKKKLRRSRKPLWTLGGALLIVLLAPGGADLSAAPRAAGPEKGGRSVIEALRDASGPLTVKLHRIYLCGDEMQTLGSMNAHSALGLLQSHPEWTAVLGNDGSVVMEQLIDDLSESCKKSAYFSVDDSGNLSLFDGPPKHKKVMRTFFQLDVHYMESSLPKNRMDELVNGIRVVDKDEYNSVLSTFSDFALEKSERVMKPAY